MKILLYCDDFPPTLGGIATYCVEVATALQESGIDVTMLTPDYNQNNEELDKTFNFKVIRYHGRQLGYERYIFKPSELIDLTFKIFLLSRKFDLIHALNYPSTIPVYCASLFKRINFYSTFHGTDILKMKNNTKIHKIFPLKNIFSKIKQVTTSSSVIKDLFLSVFPYMSDENVTSYNYGINNFWRYNFSDQQIREHFEKYQFLKNKKIVLTVARLDDRKGHDFVIDALSRFDETERSEILYLAIGSGSNNYKALLIKASESANINFKLLEGISNEDLRLFYRTATVYCMPGKICKEKIEGLGLAYLEAAAQGLPSISFRMGGVTDILINDYNSVLCEPHNIDQLKEALHKVLYDETFREKLSDNTLTKSRDYSWNNYVKKVYSLK